MQHFGVLTQPATDSIDLAVIREAGTEFASYLDTESAAPFMTGLRGALDAPIHETQVLNTALALSNVVALLTISLSEDETTASDLLTGSIARSANAAFPELLETPEPELAARSLVCRVFGTANAADLPNAVDGPVLVAIAAYGDAAIMLADDVGLPRPVLASAIGQAAAQM